MSLILFLNYSEIIGSSLENYTSNNTRQHEHNTRQHETTRHNTSETRYNTSTTRHKTSKTQHKIYFDLFISSLHTRSRVY